MSNVNGIRRALVCAIALASPVLAQPTVDRGGAALLLGRWRSLSTSRGGIGTMLEFGADGALDFSPGAIVDMPYRMEGDQLVLPPATLAGPPQFETITWLGDDKIRFRSAAALDPGQEFSRSGPRESSADPLLGEWVGSRELAGRRVKVLRLFRPRGRCLLLIPFVTQRGSYVIVDGRLKVTLPGQPMWDDAFQVADGMLTLTTADARESTYARY